MLDLVPIGVIQAVPIVTSPSECVAHVAAVDLIELLLLMESLGTTSVTYWLLTMANHDYICDKNCLEEVLERKALDDFWNL